MNDGHAVDGAASTRDARPRLLFLRFTRRNLPHFIQLHLQEQVKCLEQFFAVTSLDECADFDAACDRHQPDLVVFESGVYVGTRTVANVHTHARIPRLGFIHSDAYCPSRKDAIADMHRWGIDTCFTTSASMPAYTPELGDRLFVWPNFVDPSVYKEYPVSKVVPVLFTGSQATHYPWRNRAIRLLSQNLPCLTMPHFGWSEADATRRMFHGEAYARLISSSFIAPTCGTIANEVVRKHFEIPACGTCLVTEDSPSLRAAGFVDLVNCVFADESDILDKVTWLLSNPEAMARITQGGRDLVAQRHTVQRRNEVFQWYTLQGRLASGQKIVQPTPFSPLEIVQSSAVVQRPDASRSADRQLLAQGDDALMAGRHEAAELAYQRCLNYVGNLAEAQLRLAICRLHQGRPLEATDLLRSVLRRAFEDGNSMRPDPVEWAYLILAQWCAGNTREAQACAAQFPDLHHRELDRIVALVLAGTPEARPDQAALAPTASLHVFPGRPDDAWSTHVDRILAACGVDRGNLPPGAAIRVDAESSRLVERATGMALRPSPPALGVVVLRAVKRVLRPIRQALASRLRPSMTGPRNDVDAFAIEEILLQEPVSSALWVGPTGGATLAGLVSRALARNPNMASPIAVRPQAGDGAQRFELLAIDFSGNDVDLPSLEESGARLILLSGIQSSAGHRAMSHLLAAGHFVLIQHEAVRLGGYAVFRKCAPAQGVHRDTAPIVRSRQVSALQG